MRSVDRPTTEQLAPTASDEPAGLVVGTASADETRRLGEIVGSAVQAGDLILLLGPIGAGKTTFTQGLARGMGIAGRVTSPSFTLANVYDERGGLPLYHLDLWRMRSPLEALGIGLEEYLAGDGVCVVEWPEIAADVLPGETLRIRFGLVGDSRRIEVDPAGERPAKLVERVRAALANAATAGGAVAARD
jgi:tRNA threonylcarbamoyladenosine biosynthesis protein TsaE